MKKWIAGLLIFALCLPFAACGKKQTAPSEQEIPKEESKPKDEAPKPPAEKGILLYEGQSMPVICIETEGGKKIPADKSEVACRVSLSSDIKQDCQSDLGAVIRVRGNGSLNVGHATGKYPYKIKFDKAANPFSLGDGEARDWVLLSHGGEHTMLRDWAAKTLGELLEGIDYSPNSRLVNVYLNGEYIGVYELSEQVEVKYCRVNIDDGLKTRENGFLVELDSYGNDIQVHVGGRTYTVKSEIRREEQIDFIREYLQEVDDAVYTGDMDAIAALVDMDSLVDMYLLQEFAKNIDIGWSSFFMYGEAGGKLHFGPPWDFDLAFGNDDRLDNGAYTKLYAGTGRAGFGQNHGWFIALYKYDWFREMVHTRWREISETHIPRLITAVRAMGALVGADMQKNYKRWDFLGKKLHEEPAHVAALSTYSEHVQYLAGWMENRKAWLDKEFSEQNVK